MNVTRKNAQSIAGLKRILREEGILDNVGRTVFYISSVRSYTTTCQSGDCLKNASFYKLQFELLKQGINDDGFQVVEDFPVSKTSVCTAVGADSFVIGPDGDLYKCWLDLGRHELAVGHIGDGSLELNEKIAKWQDFQPFDDANCGLCTMLPVCMGGCPELNMRSVREEENQACCSWKYQLQDHLLHLAEKDKGAR
jgi:uncharacterized protein